MSLDQPGSTKKYLCHLAVISRSPQLLVKFGRPLAAIEVSLISPPPSRGFEEAGVGTDRGPTAPSLGH